MFHCDEWPEIAFFEGSIIVDISKSQDQKIPSFLKTKNEIGTFRGDYNYTIKDTKYTGKIEGSIPDLNIKAKISESHYLRGIEHQKNGQHSSAISEFNEAIELVEDYGMAYYNRAISYLNLDDANNATNDLEQHIKFSSKKKIFPKTYFYKGSANLHLGNLDESIKNFSKYIEMQPCSADGYFNRALAFIEMERFDDAFRDLEKTSSSEITESGKIHLSEAYFKCGNFYHKLGDMLKSKTCYDNSIKFNITYWRSYNNRGLLFCAEKDFSRAVTDFSTAIELSPMETNIYFNRAQAYEALGQTEKAQLDYSQSCKLGNQSACQKLEQSK